MCYIRLDFLSFSLDPGVNHHTGRFCTVDWFTIIGSDDGREQIGTLCGEKAGHSSRYILFIDNSKGYSQC